MLISIHVFSVYYFTLPWDDFILISLSHQSLPRHQIIFISALRIREDYYFIEFCMCELDNIARYSLK